MQEITSREKVLKNIREALVIPANTTFSEPGRDIVLFKQSTGVIEIRFAEAFKNTGGKFIYCANEKEYCHNLNSVMKAYSLPEVLCMDNDLINILEKHNIPYISDDKNLENSSCSLTRCEYLIARTGTIMISAQNKKSLRIYFTPPFHFVFAYTSQVVEDISDALKNIKSKFDKMPHFITFISGPSRTADIEKTLITGMHGPKELFLFLIDDLV